MMMTSSPINSAPPVWRSKEARWSQVAEEQVVFLWEGETEKNSHLAKAAGIS